jgi:predicted nucleic acid-binding protein
MIHYALDTNIVSYILRNDEKLIQRLNEERANGNAITIPPLVYFEMSLRGAELRGILSDALVRTEARSRGNL